MPTGIIGEISVFLSHLSFWWLLIGVLLWLMRGMGPPGQPSVDRKKFHEIKNDIEKKLKANHGIKPFEKFLLYCGRCFFIYHYYRNDLIFYGAVGGALIFKLLSIGLGRIV